jgi:hypothetical protein
MITGRSQVAPGMPNAWPAVSKPTTAPGTDIAAAPTRASKVTGQPAIISASPDIARHCPVASRCRICLSENPILRATLRQNTPCRVLVNAASRASRWLVMHHVGEAV